MIALNVIKLFSSNRDIYTKYNNIINNINLEPEVLDLFKLIHRYYIVYTEHNYISQDELIQFFNKEYPAKKDKELYFNLIKQAFLLDTSDSLAADIMKQLIETDYANKIAQHCLPIISGDTNGTLVEVQSLLEEFTTSTEIRSEDDSPFVQMNLGEIIGKKTQEGINWRLSCLQKSLGPLTGGTLGHIFARPECGKTTFLHSEVSHMVGQLEEGECILWFNNEEAEDVIQLRFCVAVTGMPEQEVTTNIDAAHEMYEAEGGNRMLLYDNASFSVEEIEGLCREYKPRIVVIDQGDKVNYKGSTKAGNKADMLKGIYDNLREVVKRCNKDWTIDIITVGQADAQCDGNKWLTQNNMDSGKTGKPGAMDYAIGVGFTYEPGDEFTRYIHLCRNKRTGDHGKYVVQIDPFRARYID